MMTRWDLLLRGGDIVETCWEAETSYMAPMQECKLGPGVAEGGYLCTLCDHSTVTCHSQAIPTPNAPCQTAMADLLLSVACTL
jgi:hypothetical protein